MTDRASKNAKRAAGKPGFKGGHRDADGEIRQKRCDATVLGLRAFEKISAVEGLQLSEEMRDDLKSLEARQMDERQRSRFINQKYGKT